MIQIIPAEDQKADAIKALGGGIVQGYQQRSDEMALQKAIGDLGENPTPRQIIDTLTKTKTYNPQAKQNLLKNYLGVAEIEEAQRKAKAQEGIQQEKNRLAASKVGDQALVRENLIKDGMPEYLADLFVNSPADVRRNLAEEHKRLKSIGARIPLVEQTHPSPPEKPSDQIPGEKQLSPLAQEAEEVGQAQEIPGVPGSNIKPTEIKKPETVSETEEEAEWPELPEPTRVTDAEKERWRAGNQTFNNKELKALKPKTAARKNALIRYDRQKKLNDSGKLPEGLGRIIIDPETGDPRPVVQLLGLVNKETQDFVKTMYDFMVDAKNYFGARVTNFDVGTFKSRLASLMNTEDGRRLIIEQMKLMEELQLTGEKTLENGLKHYGRNANYSDIVKVSDDKMSKKEEVLIEKINNLDEASNYLDKMVRNPKYKDTKLMQNQETGKFKAVRNSDVSKAKKAGYVEW